MCNIINYYLIIGVVFLSNGAANLVLIIDVVIVYLLMIPSTQWNDSTGTLTDQAHRAGEVLKIPLTIKTIRKHPQVRSARSDLLPRRKDVHI